MKCSRKSCRRKYNFYDLLIGPINSNPASVTAFSTDCGDTSPSTDTLPVDRSTATDSTEGIARRAFSTDALQWLHDIPFTL